MVTPGELDELENFFKKQSLPTEIILTQGTTITDIPKFIDTSLIILRQYRGAIHEPALLRLRKLREKLESENL